VVARAVRTRLSSAILDEHRRVGLDLAAKYRERAVALAPVLTLLAMHATVVNCCTAESERSHLLQNDHSLPRHCL